MISGLNCEKNKKSQEYTFFTVKNLAFKEHDDDHQENLY